MSALMSQLTNLHFHLPRFRGILWAVAGNADMIDFEDTLENMAIFIDVLFIDWILSFVLATICAPSASIPSFGA